ncbi:FAD-dependent oxidoreductase [Streptomyces chengmaiensis]|uniref:FAD-dependent oxidoreductase n=1 Tax=Streptomyces chengmaiensis TaxID=3040919 RepID=UPI00296244EA|nr:FAD-dependent monooxygenase [Streptomyces chengmaiensis]
MDAARRNSSRCIRHLSERSGGERCAGDLLSTTAAQEAYFSPVGEVSCKPWAHGRVVLVGDAAHASSPKMARGVATAVEDAQVLAEVLAGRGDTGDLLQQCVQRRLPRARWAQRQTHRRDRTRSLPPAVPNITFRYGAKALYERGYAPLRDRP